MEHLLPQKWCETTSLHACHSEAQTLYLSEERAKPMVRLGWHKEGKRDSEDPDIMSHPTDGEAWEALD
jgi:hypothetical protein